MISITRPSAPRPCTGHRVISMTTICPGVAPRSSPAGICTSISSRLSNGVTYSSPWSSLSNRPTVVAAPALEDADDAAFGSPVAAVPLDPHEDAVAVHRVVQVVPRDVDVPGDLVDRVIEFHEAEAVRVHRDAPRRQVHQLGHAEMPAACFNQRTAIDQRLERAPDAGSLRLLELQRPHQLLHGRRVGHALADAVQQVVWCHGLVNFPNPGPTRSVYRLGDRRGARGPRTRGHARRMGRARPSAPRGRIPGRARGPRLERRRRRCRAGGLDCGLEGTRRVPRPLLVPHVAAGHCVAQGARSTQGRRGLDADAADRAGRRRRWPVAWS